MSTMDPLMYDHRLRELRTIRLKNRREQVVSGHFFQQLRRRLMTVCERGPRGPVVERTSVKPFS